MSRRASHESSFRSRQPQWAPTLALALALSLLVVGPGLWFLDYRREHQHLRTELQTVRGNFLDQLSDIESYLSLLSIQTEAVSSEHEVFENGARLLLAAHPAVHRVMMINEKRAITSLVTRDAMETQALLPMQPPHRDRVIEIAMATAEPSLTSGRCEISGAPLVELWLPPSATGEALGAMIVPEMLLALCTPRVIGDHVTATLIAEDGGSLASFGDRDDVHWGASEETTLATRGAMFRLGVKHRSDRASMGMVAAVGLAGCAMGGGVLLGMRGRQRNYEAEQRAIDALRRSEKRFRSYYDLDMIGIAVTSLEKGWEEFNDRMCEILGYPRDELREKTWVELTYPADLEKDVTEFNRVLAGEIDGYSMEKRFVRGDGAVIYGSIQARCVRNEDGSIDHFVALVDDITDRKRAEKALRNSEERVRLLLDSTAEAIFGLNLEGEITFCNAACASILGFVSREELLGRFIDDVITLSSPAPEKSNRSEHGVLPALRDGSVVHRDDELLQSAAGKSFPVEYWAHPVQRDGELVGSVVTFFDVTERRRSEERQRLMMAELDHRVKNTLAAVISLTEQSLSQSSDLADFSQTYIGRVRSLGRAHDALALTKWSGLSISEAIRQTVAPHFAGREGQLVVNGSETELSAEAASPVCMALHELATNATKYGSLSVEKGRVEISWWQADDAHVELTWREIGGPPVSAPARRGLGLTLIEGFIAQELSGDVDLDFDSDGLRCTMRIPREHTKTGHGARDYDLSRSVES